MTYNNLVARYEAIKDQFQNTLKGIPIEEKKIFIQISTLDFGHRRRMNLYEVWGVDKLLLFTTFLDFS